MSARWRFSVLAIGWLIAPGLPASSSRVRERCVRDAARRDCESRGANARSSRDSACTCFRRPSRSTSATSMGWMRSPAPPWSSWKPLRDDRWFSRKMKKPLWRNSSNPVDLLKYARKSAGADQMQTLLSIAERLVKENKAQTVAANHDRLTSPHSGLQIRLSLVLLLLLLLPVAGDPAGKNRAPRLESRFPRPTSTLCHRWESAGVRGPGPSCCPPGAPRSGSVDCRSGAASACRTCAGAWRQAAWTLCS